MIRHTRSDVIARTTKEFQQLERLVAALKPQDWRRLVPRPESRDPWTVKDALAHILYWKEHTERVIRGEKRPPELRGLSVNAINGLIYERWRKRRPADLVAWHLRLHTQVVRTLQAVPEDWFGRREHAPDWPADFTSHSAGHRLHDIEAALR